MRLNRVSIAAALVLLLTAFSGVAKEKKDAHPTAGNTVTGRGDGGQIMKWNRTHVPKVGDAAPNVELVALDGKTKVSIAQYKGKKSVVLIFGSFT